MRRSPQRGRAVRRQPPAPDVYRKRQPAELRGVRRAALLHARPAPGLFELGGTMLARSPSARTSGYPALAAEAARAGRDGHLQHLGLAVPRGQGRRARGDAARPRSRERRVARVLQPRRRPGRARLRRPLPRDLARRARSLPAAVAFEEDLSSPTSSPAPSSVLRRTSRRRSDPPRRSTRRSRWGCATTCARTASPTSCSGCPAASTRRSPRRSPPTRSAPSTCTA